MPQARGMIHVISGGLGIRGPGDEKGKEKKHGHVTMAVEQRSAAKLKEVEWKRKLIVFTDEDMISINGPNSEALVAEMRIGDYDVEKVFFDTGSGPDILHYHAYERMKFPGELRPQKYKLFGFNNTPIGVEGVVTLPVRAGRRRNSLIVSIDFLVVRLESSYNAILGRSFLCAIKGIVSQPHLCIKFPTLHGVRIIRGDQMMAKECYYVGYKSQENGSFLERDRRYEEEESLVKRVDRRLSENDSCSRKRNHHGTKKDLAERSEHPRKESASRRGKESRSAKKKKERRE